MIDAVDVETKVEQIGPQVVGFLEESAGVKSSSRLLAFLLYGLTAIVAVAFCVYTLRGTPSAGVAGCFAGVITALGGWGAIVHTKRNQ